MKNMKFILSDKKGSALAITIVIFTIVVIMSTCLITVVTSSVNLDTKTYRQEQAYAYAQTGLSMAYKYIEDKATEPGGTDFIRNDLNNAEFEGTISDITYTDLSGISNPTDYPKFKIKCDLINDGTDEIMKVSSYATYQGTSAYATRYLYFSNVEDDDDAIDSVGDYHIKGSVKNLVGDVAGNLRGNNIDIAGSAQYSNIYALGGVTNSTYSSLDVKGDIVTYGNIEYSSGATIAGKVQSAGSVKFGNLGGNPESIIAWGESGLIDGKAVDISVSSVGKPENIDAQNVILYSGDDAEIGGTGGAGSIDLYGTVIVDGNLNIKASGITHVFGNLIVKGDITFNGGMNHLVVDGSSTSNYADEATFLADINNYSIVSVNSIKKTLKYPREFPVTVFPNVCNSPTLHPQRKASDGWLNSYVESNVDFATRQSEYKEFNLADEAIRNSINNAGGASNDDGTIKTVTYYEDYTSRGLFLNINQSGKYTNIDSLISATNPTNNSVILYLDASSQDLDIALEGNWNLGMNNWGQVKSQIIVNDGNGTHTVRIFLENNTVLTMNGATQCIGKYNSDVSNLLATFKSGGDVSAFTDKTLTSIPRLYFFSDGKLDDTGKIDTATQPKILVSTNTSTHPNGGLLRGYIYAPYSYIKIDSSSGPVPFVGKLECGNVETGGNAAAAIYYNKPDADEYSAAISGVYYPPDSGAGAGGGSVFRSRPSNRDKF